MMQFVAIIGQGRGGRNIHANYLKTDPQRFKIVAVAKLLEDRRQKAIEEL
ncbi:MAG: hypothetical protein KAQ69_03485 [Spirochaetales bacterium]|nr:hypothetical protein [Spirochaetales bacterium]